MNKIILYCLFLVCFVCLAKAQNNPSHLTGTVKNYAEKELSITVHTFWERVEETLYLKVKTDAKGNFTFSVPFDTLPARYVSFSDENGNNIFSKLLLEPKDHIHLVYDAKKFPQTLQVEGNASWKVTHYRQDDDIFQQYYQWNPNKPFMPLEQHLKLCDSLHNLRWQNFEKLKSNMTPFFQQIRYADIAGAISGKYPSSFEVREMKFEKEKEARLSAYYDSISLVRKLAYTPKQDKNLVYSDGYSMYASNLIWSIASGNSRKVGYNKEQQRWAQVVYYQFKSLLLPALAEKILGEQILQSIGTPAELAADTLLLKDYISTYPNSRYTPKIKKIYNANIRYQVGKPAFNFELETVEGKKVQLADLKGKWILIDFWGTWCGSCRKEHPYMKKVCKDLENTDFQLVLISFSDDKKDWQEYVKNKELQQPNILNLWADDKTTELLQEYYNFSAAPHKVLLDKQGNIQKWKHNHFTTETTSEIQKDLEQLLKK